VFSAPQAVLRPVRTGPGTGPSAGVPHHVPMKTLLIVEDDRLLRDNLVRETRTVSQDWLVLSADSVASAREIIQTRTLDAVFLDLGLPDGDGIQLIRLLHSCQGHCEVLVITVFADEQRVLDSLEAGASGYILKSDLPDFAHRLISTIESGGSPVSPAIARKLIERLNPGSSNPQALDGIEPLSNRESEILSLCAKGLRYAEIASVLGLSVHTVNSHLKSVYRKLMVNSRAEAVYEARRNGLLLD
jgi:DNA-binding NarL/FixJ family response regulator